MGTKKKKGGVPFSQDTENTAVLVTGGSGFIGKSFVKLLAEKEHTVVSMYRHKLPEPMPNVYPVCSDLESVDLLKAPLRGVKTVVYLAWEGNYDNRDALVAEGCFTNNIRRLKNMITAMESVGTARMIFVSANGACRLATAPFLKEKYYAETMIINSKITEKLIIRPTVVSDGTREDDRFVNSIINITKYPGIYPIPFVSGELSPLCLSDLCKLLQNSINMTLAHPVGIMEIIGQESYRIEDIFKMVSHKYTKGAKFQIRGAIGNSLVRIFERRDSKANIRKPTIRHFISLGHTEDKTVSQCNELSAALPRKMKSFKEALG